MYEEYIKQWRQFRSQYGDKTALLLMVGKFYELYDILDKTTGEGQTNVRAAVEALGITLAVREGDGPNGEDCLFAGFPEQSLQKFAALLTREGWTAVVCDQQKDSKGAVKGRPVARIFSPGTHIESAGAEAPYLAGVWLQETTNLEAPPLMAVAVLDLTTGSLKSYEKQPKGTADIWHADDVVHFFQVHPPKEVVVWWKGAGLTLPSENTLRQRLGIPPRASVHRLCATAEQQGFLETAVVRKELFQRLFQPKTMLPVLEYLHLEKRPQTERVLAALLRFAEDHLPSAVQHLAGHLPWSPEHSVYLGNNTLLQLNYITSNQETSVLDLFQECQTSLGKRALRDRLLYPFACAKTIKQNLEKVSCFLALPDATKKKIAGQLRMVYDLARLHRKVVMYSLTATDVLAIQQSYVSCLVLAEILAGSLGALAEEKKGRLREALAVFERLFPPEKAKRAQQNEEVKFLAEEEAPRTAAAEAKLAGLREEATAEMERIRLWVGLPENALRLESLDTLSYYFSGTKTTLAFIQKKLEETPEHLWPTPKIQIQSKKTGRGSVESPLLVQIHHRVLGAKKELEAAFAEELPALCRRFYEETRDIWFPVEEWIGLTDVHLTLAIVASKRGYCCPVVEEGTAGGGGGGGGGGVEALGLRHPLLESVATRVEYVRHDVSLGYRSEDDSGWLVYGMNASGKSSLMKAVGIAVLLAQAGSYVPATEFRLRPFSSILTRILNQDNLWAGLSSFAVEMSELRDIFKRADQRSLVLGDELCSGTENVSATSLVAAGIDWLMERQSRFIFATHLHGLCELPEILERPHLGIWHLRVHYEAATEKLIYDRSLRRGPGGTYYGIEVARAMNVPHAFLEKALRYRERLLGTKTEEAASPSAWNRQIQRRQCEVCGHAIVRDLEVHHIRQRSEALADGKHFADGSGRDDARNLVVVCSECHDKHHAGVLEIGPLRQTSEGPVRDIKDLSEAAPVQPLEAQKAKSQKSQKTEKEEKKKAEQEAVEAFLRKYPTLPLKRLVFDLNRECGIQISEAALRKIRSQMV